MNCKRCPSPHPDTCKLCKKETERNLYALSTQQGHYGTIDVQSVAQIIELRDEKIRALCDVVRVKALAKAEGKC